MNESIALLSDRELDLRDEIEARSKVRERILASKAAIMRSQQALNEAEIVKQLALSSVDVDLSWDFKTEPTRWLVKDVVPDAYDVGSGTLLCMYGPPGAGKTFAALDVAECVGAGLPWAGVHPVEGARAGNPVVWVAMEGSAALAARHKAWIEANRGRVGYSEPLLFRVKSFEGLANPNAARALAYKLHYEFELDDPALIVVDTLQAAMVGMDENSVEDMSKAVGQLRWLCDYFSCPLLFVHHTSKKSLVERGSSYLRGSTDGMYLVNDGAMRVTRFKEAPFNEEKFWSFDIADSGPSAYARFVCPEDGLSERSSLVLTILRDHGPLTPKQIREALSATSHSVEELKNPAVAMSVLLANLRDRGLVTVDGATSARTYRLV